MKSTHVSSKSPNSVIMEKRSFISPAIKNQHSRGARFLDLVKQNKLNVSPQLNKKLTANKNIIKDLMEKGSKKEDEYLKFSNDLPDLSSSPSSSILSKRKAAEQETETPDSPSLGNSAKRKRVSFNDPVSTTKEYLISEEEERHKSNSLIRCLKYDEGNENEESESKENKENIKIVQDFEVKIESIEEETVADVKEKDAKSLTRDDDKAEYQVKDHDYYDKDENPQNFDITTSSMEEVIEQMSSEEEEEVEGGRLVFKNKSELMDYIIKNISIDELHERMTTEKEATKQREFVKEPQAVGCGEILDDILPVPASKHSKLTPEYIENIEDVVNHLSRMMKANDKVKHKVLESLSEKHSKDFLSHALQENSPAQVFEKLTMPILVNHIIHKANVCDDDEISFEINRMNRSILQFLIKKTSESRDIIFDLKETQELLKLLFQNMNKIDVIDALHEFTRYFLTLHTV